jgi:hypothetical protein
MKDPMRPELTPTSIVDVNGRQTTVHKKQRDERRNFSFLGQLRPTLEGAPSKPAGEQWIVKGQLHPDSICLRVPHIMEVGLVTKSSGNNSRAVGDGVAMDDAEVYEYLRMGIDPTDAAVFKMAGYVPRDLRDDPEVSPLLPGYLQRVYDGFHNHILSNERSIDAMQNAGITASRASVALKNGLSEHHFDGVLDVEQVVDLFMRNSYNRNPRLSPLSKSGVLDAIVRGDIPLELPQHVKITNLQWAADELSGYHGDRVRQLRDRDPERYKTLLVKASQSQTGVLAIHDLGKKYTERVFELKDPFLADRKYGESGKRYGLVNANYLEAVMRAAPKGATSDWVKPKESSGPPPFSSRSAVWQLRGADMVALREAGATPEMAYDLISERGMRLEQAVAVARGDTIIALSDGVL